MSQKVDDVEKGGFSPERESPTTAWGGSTAVSEEPPTNILSRADGNGNVSASSSRSPSGTINRRKSARIDEYFAPPDAEEPGVLLRTDTDPDAGLGGHGLPRRVTIDSAALKRSMSTLLRPEKKIGKAPSYTRSFVNTVKCSWLNVLLLFIPVSWACHFFSPSKVSPLAEFIFAFLAIIPLAKLLGFATEELSIRVGQTLGGLINASLGNAVELIVAIIALFHCELVVVQSSLLGSILSNLLLVLGMCLFVGGVRFKEQEFKVTAAQLNSSLLTMAVISLIIPAAFHATLGNDIPDPTERVDLLKLSRGTAVILLLIYLGYLGFSLYTHTEFYEDEESGEEETPQLNFPYTIMLLVVVTVFVGVTAEWLVDAIDGFTQDTSANLYWTGIILLPIASNAAEHVTAVTVAWKDKLDLSMGVAVGSSIQIALFVIPLLVVIAWIAGKPLSLLFDPYSTIILFFTVLAVNYCIQDGRANWMEGFIMIYIVVAVSFWFYPSSSTDFFQQYCSH